jgi:hypothetical protein
MRMQSLATYLLPIPRLQRIVKQEVLERKKWLFKGLIYVSSIFIVVLLNLTPYGVANASRVHCQKKYIDTYRKDFREED